MLCSIGTKTKKEKESRSPNFLGKYYQDFLSNPEKIEELINKKLKGNEVYEIIDVYKNTFIFGKKQNKLDLTTY